VAAFEQGASVETARIVWSAHSSLKPKTIKKNLQKGADLYSARFQRDAA
jgi:hypothetical protein